MKNWSTIFMGLLLLTAPLSFAQELSIEVAYLNGKAQSISTNSARPTKIGDKLNRADSIKLEKDTQVELVYKTWHIKIAEPGTYKVVQLVDNLENQNNYQLVDNAKLSSLLSVNKNKKVSKPAGIMGQAGVRAGVENETFKNEIDELRRGVKSLLNGDSKKATEVIESAFESYTGSDPAFYYYYSLALLEEGKPTKALSIIDNADLTAESFIEIEGGPDPLDVPEAMILLKGYIFINRSDFVAADTWASESLKLRIGIDTRQEVLMMRAMANNALRKPGVWKDILEEVVTLDPTSDYGIQAKKLLQSAGK